jgi:glycosyltransferase involved in cell wall biosynthesis
MEPTSFGSQSRRGWPDDSRVTPLRIALIDPSLFTLPYDQALAHGLQQAGHRVTLFGRTPGSDDGELDGLDLEPHFYRVANSPLAQRLPRAARLGLKGLDHAVSMMRLRGALRRLGPDVIHFQWLALPLVDRRMLASLRRIAPLVLTVHDTNPFNGDPSAGLQQHGFFVGLSGFDQLIVHTQQGRVRMKQAGVPANKLVVLPHGLLFDPPSLPAPDPMDGPVTFLLFGKVKPYKGLDVLIDAFASLPPALRENARIRVVGKPYMDMAPIRAQAERLGVGAQLVIEPRFVADDEIPALFGPGVVAMMPYREIEASGVLSIALAYGRPIIASDIGNFSETITDGVQGHLVPPGDAPRLRDAMAHILSDRRFAARCAVEARNSADSIPNWAEIGRMTVATYLAAGAAPHASSA